MKNRFILSLGRLAAFAALLVAPGILPALSVLAPDFNTLVDDADAIFQGEVLSVRSDWTGAGENRHIATFVEFRVIKVFKGSAPNPQTLELFGGTVGDRGMKIPGLPQFKVGDNEMLFVKDNGKSICPLVGAYHGRFHVTKDFTTNSERVALNDGRPLTDTKQIGKSAESVEAAPAVVQSTSSGMTVAEFGQRIQARLAERSASSN